MRDLEIKGLTQAEIEKAFASGDISGLRYYVKVEGHVIITDFTYGGLRECQEFIHQHGKKDINYTICVIDA